MKGYVICKLGLYNVAKPTFRVPKLYLYMSGFEVKSTAGNWCVVIVDDVISNPIPAVAEADPDIFVFDTESELDTVITAAKRNAINSYLSTQQALEPANPVLAVRVAAGETVRVFLGHLRGAMGHTVESWGLGV